MKRIFTYLFLSAVFVTGSFGQMVVQGDVTNTGNLKSMGSVIVKTKATATSSNGKIVNRGTINLSNGITYNSTDTDDGELVNSYIQHSGEVNFLEADQSYKNVRVAKTFKTDRFNVISLPFDVDTADIRLATDANLTTLKPMIFNKDYAIFYYDIKHRAEYGPDGNAWQEETDTIRAGIAYYIWVDKAEVGGVDYATLVFPAANATTIQTIYSSHVDSTNHKHHDRIFFHKHDKTNPQSHGWNFIGNKRTATYYLSMDNTRLDSGDNILFIWATYHTANSTEPLTRNIDLEDDDQLPHVSPYTGYYIQIDGAVSGERRDLFFHHDGLIHAMNNPINDHLRSTNKRNVIALDLQGNGSTYSDRLTVKKSDGYTNSYKLGEDAPKLFNNVAAEFYTQVGDVPMSINKYQTIEGDLPVGLRVKDAGTYTISLANLSGFDDDIYLIDKETNEKHNLLDGNYTFTASTTTEDITNRLFLRFGNSITHIDPFNSNISVYTDNNTVYVKNVKVGDQIAVYNVAGQVIGGGVATSNEQSYPLAGAGVYVVKVTGSESYISKVINK